MSRLTPAIALMLILAGCDDPVSPARPGPEPRAEGLTETQSVSLFTGITRLTFADTDVLRPGSLMIECPNGGQLNVVETIEEYQMDDGHGEVAVAFAIRPTSCSLTISGDQFIVDGRLDIQLGIETSESEMVAVTGTLAGELLWGLPERSGRCPVGGRLVADAEIIPDPDTQGTGYFSGSVCGHDVRVDFSELLWPLPHLTEVLGPAIIPT